MRSKFLFALSLLLALSCVAHGQNAFFVELEVDGFQRECLVFVPSSANTQEPMPLLLDYHGFGSTAEYEMNRSGFVAMAEELGFVAAFPQGVEINGNSHWNVGGFTQGSPVDDVKFSKALVDTLLHTFSIDPLRVYATGMSNGGFMALRLACELDDYIAAVGSVSGSMAPEILAECKPSRPIAVIQIHGTTDDVIPYDGFPWTLPVQEVMAFWAQANGCEEEPMVTQLDDLDTEDSTVTILYEYNQCDSSVRVEHYQVLGGGHSWPGSRPGFPGVSNDFSASEVMFSFLSQFTLLESPVVSVESSASRSEISVTFSPNPVSGDFVYVRGASTPNVVRVMNINGKLLNTPWDAASRRLDVSNLPPGLYAVKVDNTVVTLLRR